MSGMLWNLVILNGEVHATELSHLRLPTIGHRKSRFTNLHEHAEMGTQYNALW